MGPFNLYFYELIAQVSTAIQFSRTTLKSAHNTLHCLIENNTDNALQHRVFKLKIHKEGYIATAFFAILESPCGLHIAKWSIEILCINFVSVRAQHNPAAEPFAKNLEGYYQISLHHLGRPIRDTTADTRGCAPWQKFGVTRHISHQIIHLLGAIGQRAGFRMGWHAS